MGKQDRKRVTWDSRSSHFNVIRLIEMGIVDTGKLNALSATFDYLTFIYQHSDSHLLKTGQHSDRVVISEDSINWVFYRGTNARHASYCCIVQTKSIASVVTS